MFIDCGVRLISIGGCSIGVFRCFVSIRVGLFTGGCVFGAGGPVIIRWGWAGCWWMAGGFCRRLILMLAGLWAGML